MTEVVAIWINCPSREVAEEIGDALLSARLVAAINIFPEVASRYVWNGEIRTATETPLFVKTRRELFDAVASQVCSLHPYETPGVIAMEIGDATADYRAWIGEVTRE